MQARRSVNNGLDISTHQRHRRRILDRRRIESKGLLKDQRCQRTAPHGEHLERQVIVPHGRNGNSHIDEDGCADDAGCHIAGVVALWFADEVDDGVDEEGLGKGEACVKEAGDDSGCDLPSVCPECAP